MSEEFKKQTKSILSGGAGGICLVAFGHPLDLIKVNLQTASATAAIQPTMSSVFQRILKTEGIRGFYKGMSTPLLGITPVTAVYFWGYDVGLRAVRWVSGSKKEDPYTLSQIAIAGGLSAIPGTALMTPIERIKCILQIQNMDTNSTTPKYSGPSAVVKDILKKEGVQGLYKGSVATLARDFPGSVMWFGVYEVVKKALTPEDPNKKISPLSTLFAGGMAGCANWAVAIPPDVIKSRLQTAPEGTYSGFLDCFRKLVANEGFGALFKGLGPAMVRAFPANAACFFGAETARSFLNSIWP